MLDSAILHPDGCDSTPRWLVIQTHERTRAVRPLSPDKTTMSLLHSERQGKTYGVVVVVLNVAWPCASGKRTRFLALVLIFVFINCKKKRKKEKK